MRGFVSGALFVLVVLGGAGFVALKTGTVNVSARAQPSALEREVAEMALDAAVERREPHRPNPFQANDQNLAQGARIYEANCAYCHGGAEDPVSPLGRQFNPRVPQLVRHIPDDPDSHLFWIVQNGIRWTGMPGWQGILSEDDMWKAILFVKSSDKLSPAVQAEWKKVAARLPAAVK